MSDQQHLDIQDITSIQRFAQVMKKMNTYIHSNQTAPCKLSKTECAVVVGMLQTFVMISQMTHSRTEAIRDLLDRAKELQQEEQGNTVESVITFFIDSLKEINGDEPAQEN